MVRPRRPAESVYSATVSCAPQAVQLAVAAEAGPDGLVRLCGRARVAVGIDPAIANGLALRFTLAQQGIVPVPGDGSDDGRLPGRGQVGLAGKEDGAGNGLAGHGLRGQLALAEAKDEQRPAFVPGLPEQVARGRHRRFHGHVGIPGADRGNVGIFQINHLGDHGPAQHLFDVLGIDDKGRGELLAADAGGQAESTDDLQRGIQVHAGPIGQTAQLDPVDVPGTQSHGDRHGKATGPGWAAVKGDVHSWRSQEADMEEWRGAVRRGRQGRRHGYLREASRGHTHQKQAGCAHGLSNGKASGGRKPSVLVPGACARPVRLGAYPKIS